MTDKHIIIDGVDVSGCYQYMHRHMEDYDIDTLNYCRYHFKPCKDVDVKYCYYKQLKREEQELQQAMDNYVQLDLQRVKEYNELVDLYKAKEQECKELKEDIERWKSNFNGKVSAIEELLQQLDQLKQTLTEIKEIAKYDVYITRADLRFKLDLIKSKISEVLNDRQKQQS